MGRYGVEVKIRFVVLNAYALGGTTRTVVNQANALCGDHDVEIASVFRHAEAPGFRIDPRVKLIPLTNLRSDGTKRTDPPTGPSTRRLGWTRRYRNRLPHKHDHRFKRWDPVVDLAVLRYFWSSLDGVLVTTRPGMNLLSARMAPRRLVRVGQDHMHYSSYKPWLQAAIRRHYGKLDALSVLTERDKQEYTEVLGHSALRIERIPNGIPRSPFPPAALDSRVLVAAGRLSSHKGFDMLVDAFATVSAKHPDWQLWMFGAGGWKTRLTEQIARLGLTGKAHLKGTTEHLDEQFAASSIFVLSSRFEGLPMVLLESMAAGLPAVAFDCPTGPREIIDDGRTGLLVPAEDVDALAAGLCELIEDPERRRAMGAAALVSSEAYAIDAVKDSWVRLYSELAAARRRRS